MSQSCSSTLIFISNIIIVKKELRLENVLCSLDGYIKR